MGGYRGMSGYWNEYGTYFMNSIRRHLGVIFQTPLFHKMYSPQKILFRGKIR